MQVFFLVHSKCKKKFKLTTYMFVYLVYPVMLKSYKTVRLNLITLFSKVVSIP